jgi:GNAT superfamily N-acetyltransferase
MQIVSHTFYPDMAAKLCALAQLETKRSVQAQNFELTGTHTLNFLLNQGKFSRKGSDYQMLVKGDDLVCGAGVYVYHEEDVDGERVSIIMSRMYTSPKYRGHWHGSRLLRSLAKVCVTPTCMITFNQANTLLYESLTNKRRGLLWPNPWRAFRPIGEHTVNSVPQMCAVAYTHDLV